MTDTYLVRQYRPAYFSGFENEVVRDVPLAELANVAFLNRFKYAGFKDFRISKYTDDELIIVAHYENGEKWVAAFATKSDSPIAADWRYAQDTLDTVATVLAELPPSDYSATVEVDEQGRFWAVGDGKAAGRRWFLFDPKEMK